MGDTKVLTDNGFEKISSLNNHKDCLIDNKGNKVAVELSKSGIQETIIVKLSNDKEIICTPYTKFFTFNNREVPASSIANYILTPYPVKPVNGEDEVYVKNISKGTDEMIYSFYDPSNNNRTRFIIEGFEVLPCENMIVNKEELFKLLNITK